MVQRKGEVLDGKEQMKTAFSPPSPPVRESDLRELRKTLERAQVEQEALQRQLLELQVRRSGGRQPVPISAARCSAQGLAWWARKLERKTTWSD